MIVPANNEEKHLAEQLDALLAQRWSGSWEVIVANNCSSDGTADLVRRYAAGDDRVRLIDAHERADKSYAMNVAAAHARAEFIAFCDADDRVADGWLNAMAAGLARSEVVTGPNEIDELNAAWLAASRGRSINQARGTFLGIFPCIRGNNFGVKKSIWLQLNGMTENFRACEDIEFSLRCWLNGIDIVGLPEAVVHYRYRDSADALWRQGFAYGSHRPIIARMLRDADRPTPPKFAGWKSWLMLAVRLPTLATRHGRATWIWIAGNRVGQVVGSYRQRTFML